MTTPRTKWLGLLALVLLWMVLWYVMVVDVPPPAEVPLTYRSGQTATKSVDEEEKWDVHSLRAQARELPVAPQKNIFFAGNQSRSSDPQTKLVAQQGKLEQQAAVVMPPTLPPPPPPPPPPTSEELAQQQAALRRIQLQEQMTQYRYLGYVNQNGVQKAFLGKGRELYIIREGDTLEGKFQVAHIEATSVKLLDADSKLETTLRLKKEEGTGT